MTGPSLIALIGDNGSGKSTLLRMLTGQEALPTGSVQWGKDAKVGYLEQEIVREFDEASGGEKKILKLTQLFYSDSNVLLLDEPTNHLDLKTVLALENFLVDYPGTLVLVSHDRELVDKVASIIYQLVRGRLEES